MVDFSDEKLVLDVVEPCHKEKISTIGVYDSNKQSYEESLSCC
jgi:hypothetical protein